MEDRCHFCLDVKYPLVLKVCAIWDVVESLRGGSCWIMGGFPERNRETLSLSYSCVSATGLDLH